MKDFDAVMRNFMDNDTANINNNNNNNNNSNNNNINSTITTTNNNTAGVDNKNAQIRANRRDIVCGLQFGDFYITNMKEQGINAQRGQAFQPYQVTQIDGKGVQVDPSTTVTPDCLLRKIEWKYTTGFPKSSLPRVGCLTLTKANGQVVSITR